MAHPPREGWLNRMMRTMMIAGLLAFGSFAFVPSVAAENCVDYSWPDLGLPDEVSVNPDECIDYTQNLIDGAQCLVDRTLSRPCE